MARELNESDMATARGGQCHPSSVANLLRRLGGLTDLFAQASAMPCFVSYMRYVRIIPRSDDAFPFDARYPSAHAAGAKRLRCDFNEGVFHAWGEPTEAVTDSLSLTFENIDTEQGTAKMEGNAGTSDVLVTYGDRRMTLIEITGSGNVNTTSVYFGKDIARSVHSRHTGIVEDPLLSQLSQYTGTCFAY